ncbi:uncharacterized protein TRIVIDRAFT_188113 [Trichoderma virens Gv29-8]|uniref:Uncharacterized protein n=1 Tax=Hypocrea virens (strain Gv29-8 / FGSC 10586) TaxID=413071 RepID=G9MDQ2_HYPVG|nr:uncharacterized protein TRIVIDRAFT_188113 [Trichoderma virens Gv29-8]EHK27211.1 hypothetical protein TRIVIDRAFT_188113 [Trichoderma virens Gv29-8]
MGMQGPLVAQALGRSPFDDVVQGEGEDDSRVPSQQYDHGGRPINPDTMRINRDIIRSHNQVMFIIGIAEPENPGPEVDSQRRHGAYEEAKGLRLASSAKRCVEAVGLFGINGLRDRILIYKRYSRIPFWELYQQARRDFSIPRDILSGVPANLLSNYIEFTVSRLWFGEEDKLTARRCNEGGSPAAPVDSQMPSDAGSMEVVRRPSIFSARGDDYGSDEEDNDVIRATLISFDVEATESTDAPQGLWSAELRPSVANTDSRGSVSSLPTYLDTLLTQIPALLASHMLSNSVTRLLMTPYDAAALRLVAQAFCLRNGLSYEDICDTNLLSGCTWTSIMNYLGTEFLHLFLTTEIWAVFTGLSQYYHFTEEEWAAEEAKNQ